MKRRAKNPCDVDGQTLPAVVGRLLTERRWTLAVAESCTGGYIADQLTNVPGASGYFACGVVAYSNAAKVTLLGIPEAVIARHGAVSAATATAMAEGIRRQAGTTLGLSVTGIAGPTGGTAQKPVGTVYIGLTHPKGTVVVHRCAEENRLAFKESVGAMALDLVRHHIMESVS